MYHKDLIFQRENYIDIVEEVEPITPAISREVDIYPDAAQPNVDHERLVSMGDATLAVTARTEEGELVGFTISSIVPDVLFKHVLTSYSLFYYLDPRYRGHGNGTKLFEVTEEWYDKLGVERSFLPRKLHLDNQEIFKKLEYIPVEVTYTKYRGN